MSGLKNSPFGKRLRASHKDEEEPTKKKLINPIFGVPSSTPSLDSRPNTTDSSAAPESPTDIQRIARGRDYTPRDYGDRFVPSRDSGDMRTSFHLLDEGGPSTPSKNRIIPSESDALKGHFYSQSHTEPL